MYIKAQQLAAKKVVCRPCSILDEVGDRGKKLLGRFSRSNFGLGIPWSRFSGLNLNCG